jgi:hypothetical protein
VSYPLACDRVSSAKEKDTLRFLKPILPLVLAVAPLAANTSIRVNIPFAFEVNGATLPAGNYTVEFANNQPVVHLKSQHGAEQSYALASPAALKSAPGEPKLIFKRVGDRYVLAHVGGPTLAANLAQSK